jgi:hypothetical protein
MIFKWCGYLSASWKGDSVSSAFLDRRRDWWKGREVGTCSRKGVFTCMYGIIVGLGGFGV